MDTLHTVIRSIRGETKAPRDHLTVFREFLNHLDRASKKRGRAVKSTAKTAGKRRRTR